LVRDLNGKEITAYGRKYIISVNAFDENERKIKVEVRPKD